MGRRGPAYQRNVSQGFRSQEDLSYCQCMRAVIPAGTSGRADTIDPARKQSEAHPARRLGALGPQSERPERHLRYGQEP